MTVKGKGTFLVIFCIFTILAVVLASLYYLQVNPLITGKELTGGYRCVTTESQIEQTQNNSVIVLKKEYTHKVYAPNGEYISAIEVTIIGTVEESTSSLTSLDADLTEEDRSGLTLSEHCTGDTGTVIVYLNQSSICYFQYRLNADGIIELL